MSNIHYFQRYSSKENAITNNTLLLLTRIYEYSRVRVNDLLKQLVHQDIEIGLQIVQQSSGSKNKKKEHRSIPDASIKQQSFKILIEAKDESPASEKQLLDHANHFEGESLKILILLTKKHEDKISSDFTKKKSSDLFFKNITYKELCDSINGLFESHEAEILEVVSDYMSYCSEEGLIDNSNSLMRIVPCGDSLELNKKYGLYHQPMRRSCRKHKFIGCYSQKSVRAILKIENEYCVENIASKNPNIKLISGSSNQLDDDKKRILSCLNDPQYPFKPSEPLKFYLGSIEETNFIKTSNGGVMSSRYVDLSECLSPVPHCISDIAKALRQENFD